MFEAANSTFVG